MLSIKPPVPWTTTPLPIRLKLWNELRVVDLVEHQFSWDLGLRAVLLGSLPLKGRHHLLHDLVEENGGQLRMKERAELKGNLGTDRSRESTFGRSFTNWFTDGFTLTFKKLGFHMENPQTFQDRPNISSKVVKWWYKASVKVCVITSKQQLQ